MRTSRILTLVLAGVIAPHLAFSLTVTVIPQRFSVTQVSFDGKSAIGHQGHNAAGWSAATGLVDMGGYYGGPMAMSADGSTVVGHTTQIVSQEPYITTEPAVWRDGITSTPSVVPTLGYDAGLMELVSDNGRVATGWVGDLLSAGQAVRWDLTDGGAVVTPLGSAVVAGISADGSVLVGNTYLGNTGQHVAFRWEAGADLVPIAELGPTGGDQVWGVSGDGKVVFGSRGDQLFKWTESAGAQPFLEEVPWGRFIGSNDDGTRVAFSQFLWDERLGLIPASQILALAGLDPADWLDASLVSLRGDGTTLALQAYYGPEQMDRSILLTDLLPVPEPATFGLWAAAALCGLGAWRHRRAGASPRRAAPG